MNPPRVAVAYSGGRDSTALLHATAKAAAEQGVEVLALHVHHGLSEHADAWLAACEAQCRRWDRRGWPITFIAERLSGQPKKGESVEAWARQARYAALRTMAIAHGATLVLLAHHRRDQAETFLLQALRSAGVTGLSGMPRVAQRDGVTWLRPWLDVPRETIDAYVRRHRLKHIDDDSNADTRYARNRLRHRVWDALTEAFPHAEAALVESAAWAQEAAAGLAELAAIDMPSVQVSEGLDVRAWSALSAARRSNVLRAWLRAQTGRAPSASLVSRLMRELPGIGSASWTTDAGTLRRYRGVLRHESNSMSSDGATGSTTTLSIRRAGRYAVPQWGGVLDVRRTPQGGVPLAWLAQLELRPRTGGERFQSGFGRPPRSLKKQFQAAAVPAWLRDGPLVYSGGQLVYVPGLGIDARVIALPGQPQVTMQWVATPAADRSAG